MPQRTVNIGQDLKGAITVSSVEEFAATDIRGELRCVERKKREKWVYIRTGKRRERVLRTYWETTTLHSDDPIVCKAIHIIPGFKKTFPLQVNIPAGGRASFDGSDENITWTIKGVIAIKGRPDVTSEVIELQIVRPHADSITKHLESPSIPCEYCGTLMLQTVTSCPICGATRKT
jgi:hypothetical protein